MPGSPPSHGQVLTNDMMKRTMQARRDRKMKKHAVVRIDILSAFAYNTIVVFGSREVLASGPARGI